MAHESNDTPRSADSDDDASREARRRTAFLEQEVELLRAKVAESPRHMRILEERLADVQARSRVSANATNDWSKPW